MKLKKVKEEWNMKPNLDLSKQINDIAGIISKDILQGMKEGKGVDGRSMPSNEPETVARKGHNKILFDTGKLSRFYIKKRASSGDQRAEIAVPKKREGATQGLAIDGIKTKKGRKFYKFWGVSERAETQANKYIFMEIRRLMSR